MKIANALVYHERSTDYRKHMYSYRNYGCEKAIAKNSKPIPKSDFLLLLICLIPTSEIYHYHHRCHGCKQKYTFVCSN